MKSLKKLSFRFFVIIRYKQAKHSECKKNAVTTALAPPDAGTQKICMNEPKQKRKLAREKKRGDCLVLSDNQIKRKQTENMQTIVGPRKTRGLAGNFITFITSPQL